MHDIHKTIKILVITMMILVLSIINVYAGNDINAVQISDNVVSVTGKANGEWVMVNIFPKGKGYSDLENLNEKKDVLVYHDQIEITEDGTFNLEVELGESGIYTVFYSIDGNTPLKAEIASVEVREDISEITSIIADEQKTENEKIQAVKAMLTRDEYIKALGLDKDTYNADDDEIAEYFYNSISEEPLIQEGKETDLVKSIVKIFRRGVGVSAMKNGDIFNVFEDAEYFSLDETAIAEQYKKDCVNEEVQIAASKRVAKLMPEKESEFETAIRDALILSVVENPDGPQNAKEIMDDFADVIGITPEKSIERYEKNVVLKSFDTLAELKDAYEKELPKKNNSAGGGSSSGGGSSKKNNTPSTVVTTPLVPTVEAVPADIYKDINDAVWAKEYIVGLTEMGIVSGKGDGLFCPNDNITREEFTKLIVEAFYKDEEPATIGFSDVLSGAWYYDYIAKAVSKGIINGKGDNLFGTGELITRQDMAVIAFRATNFEISEYSEIFIDSEQISDYAKDAVTTLYTNGILNGSDGFFKPFDNATRAEAAKIIYMLLTLN